MIKIEYTDLARTFLSRLGEADGLPAFEERLKGELSELMGEQDWLENLLFHTIEYNKQEYIIYPKKLGYLLVDTTSREEEELEQKEGPFKGRKFGHASTR